jgi:hypothetical protein
MFSRATRRHRANDIEHMVVELKAPKVKIGADEITQAKKYAIAVTSDERFATVYGVRWHFWLVSNSYDEFAKHEMETGPDRDRRLIAKGPRHIVGIRTWGSSSRRTGLDSNSSKNICSIPLMRAPRSGISKRSTASTLKASSLRMTTLSRTMVARRVAMPTSGKPRTPDRYVR